MRVALYEAIKSNDTPGSWEHIINQNGMFTYTGLNKKQCKVLVEKHHVYLLSSGRISVAGLGSNTVQYVADSIHDVVTNY